jgi:hypothetical protein
MTTRESSDPVPAEFRFIADDCHAPLARQDLTEEPQEVLMPLEAVAKAILVKANGLPAYWKATGLRPQRNHT